MFVITESGEERGAISFRKQTPQIYIGCPLFDPLYEKAFLTPFAEADHEYDRNTTTWD